MSAVSCQVPYGCGQKKDTVLRLWPVLLTASVFTWRPDFFDKY